MRKPKLRWGQFLDAAPYFMEALWQEDDALGEEWSPLVRAVAFYDVFRGEVENGGVSQYLFNRASSLPYFAEAPEIVRHHPLLGEVSALMAEIHGNEVLIRHFVQAQRDLTAASIEYARTRQGGTDPITYEEKYQTYTREFDRRAAPAIAAAFTRLQYDIVRHPNSYFDLPAIGRGVKARKEKSATGLWRLRFVDGFPIGPNIQDDEFGGRFLRFTSTRSHLEFDQPRLGSHEPDLGRTWIDLQTGVSCTRTFKDGRLTVVDSKLCMDDHGLQEYYEDNGRPTYSGVGLNGMRVEMHRRDLKGSPFTVTLPGPNGEIVRRYFGNGQLNTERLILEEFPFPYTRCLDEAGNELAPGGTGQFREVWGFDERGPRWREGALVNGLLEGELRYFHPDGALSSSEHYVAGKLQA
jgi:hypothetical protein